MKLGRFLTTLGIGALAGMLLAPKKGSELREELKDKGKETLDSAKEMTVEDYQKLISETIDSIKKTVDEFDVDEFKESSLEKINELIEISEKTIKNIKQNLFWAFFYNICMIPIACGILEPIGIEMNPMVAAFAMTISSLTVVLNALRLKK